MTRREMYKAETKLAAEFLVLFCEQKRMDCLPPPIYEAGKQYLQLFHYMVRLGRRTAASERIGQETPR